MSFPDYYLRAFDLYGSGKSVEALSALANWQEKDFLPAELWNAYYLLSLIRHDLGETEAALKDMRKAIELTADMRWKRIIYSNYLMCLHYLPDVSIDYLRSEHWKYNDLFQGIKQFSHTRKNKDKLKIGYLSANFASYVVVNFVIQLFACHDRNCFEVICYDLGQNENRTTEQLKTLVDGWERLNYEDPYAAAKKIYDDETDILVDLCGHTEGGLGLQIAAYKPAPVQICMIGWFDTTGLSAIDYFLGDVYCDNSEAEKAFSETVLKLPHSHFCYTPKEEVFRTENEYTVKEKIVFGSFNNFAKITDEMLAVWLKILNRVPGSRLLLKNARANKRQEKEIWDKAIALGYSANQLEIRTRSNTYAQEYGELDIALDTYPYPGGGTTCDALFMGVPVVTFCGNRHGSRFGYSLLMNCGIGELAAQTEDEYIEKAVALANDRELLSALHLNLRQIMIKSPLMNGRGYTQEVEEQYKKIWEKWLKNA